MIRKYINKHGVCPTNKIPVEKFIRVANPNDNISLKFTNFYQILSLIVRNTQCLIQLIINSLQLASVVFDDLKWLITPHHNAIALVIPRYASQTLISATVLHVGGFGDAQSYLPVL